MSITLNSDNCKLNQMFNASLESIAYRQDRFGTGGIVESDHRQDNGFLYGGGKTCYPRVFLAKNLLTFGEAKRAEKFCRFWMNAQLEDGSFQKCHPVIKSDDIPEVDKGETDTNGHILRHWGEYFVGTGDRAFLNDCLPQIQRVLRVIQNLYNPTYQMCHGEEETIIRNPEGETGTDEQPHIPGYTMQINTAIQLGLSYAAHMLEIGKKKEDARQAAALAEEIRLGIRANLWDKNAQRYLFGLKPDGVPYRGAMWFALMHSYASETWDIFADKTLWHSWSELYDKDPVLPKTYWSNDFTLLKEGKYSRHSRYSGAGPMIGVSPAICQMMMMAGRFDMAGEHLESILKYTDESNLIPEHINTLSAGQEGRFQLYPKEPCRVDRGNLLHLGFFLSLIRWMIGRRNNYQLIPSLPDTIRSLEVTGLSYGDQQLDYSYQTTGDAKQGRTVMSLSASGPLSLTVGLRSSASIQSVKVDGQTVRQYELVDVFQNRSYQVLVPITVSKSTTVEVNW